MNNQSSSILKEFSQSLIISPEARLGIVLVCVLAIIIVAQNFGNRSTQITVQAPVIEANEIVHGDTSKKQIIFTFDGGSGIQSADRILNTLAAHNVKGTFFLTGKFIESNSELVKRIANSGHEIFNHTYDHPHLPTLSDSEIVDELGKMEQVLMSTVGKSSGPYFRAPFGDRDERVIKEAYKNGYQSVYWTVDANDWLESEGVTAHEVRNTVLNSLAPGNIYLMHIGDNITGNILDELFTTIESKGYRIVSLSQGL